MKPFAHQASTLATTATLPAFAIFWEQGTGKTKLALDTALALRGAIDAVLVVAPNGVHLNWVTDELPKHAPTLHGFAYHSSKANTKGHAIALEQMMRAEFPLLAMSYDAVMTERGRKVVKRFLTRPVLFILDESAAIKNPNAKRTKTLLAAGKHAPYRRILTGTPVSNSPFDVYSQMRFLDPMFWRAHGFSSFAGFKQHFGIWRQGYNDTQARTFEFVVGYRNLAELQAIIAPMSSRVTKDDTLDLPPKLYQTRYFDLTATQARVYRELRDYALTTLNDTVVTTPLAITLLLRLAQVTANWLDDAEIDTVNPRLNALLALLDETPHGAIVWARFRRDVDAIMAALGSRAVRYDGAVSNDDRAIAKQRFQSGDAQFFVGNPAAGGMGLTLTAARTVIYYNNTFRLADRLQSEDRAHRIGQTHPVYYIDIVAPGTVDVHIRNALRRKVNIASAVTGDNLKEWL